MARSQTRAGSDQVSGRILTRGPDQPPRPPGVPSQVVGCAYHQPPLSNPVAVAAEADQQLSLAAALGLPEESPTPSGSDPAPEPEALASGPARPRTRQPAPATTVFVARLICRTWLVGVIANVRTAPNVVPVWRRDSWRSH